MSDPLVHRTTKKLSPGKFYPLGAALRDGGVNFALFSQGTPMILGGDEFLRTQKGNNNAYCQDNDMSWFDWELEGKNSEIRDFVKKAIAFRKRYGILRGRKYLTGTDQDSDGMPDISWFGMNLDRPGWDFPDAGREMTLDPQHRCIANPRSVVVLIAR